MNYMLEPIHLFGFSFLSYFFIVQKNHIHLNNLQPTYIVFLKHFKGNGEK